MIAHLRSRLRRRSRPAAQQPPAAPPGVASTPRATPSLDPRFATSWGRLARIALGQDAVPAAPQEGPFDPALATSAARSATRVRARALLAEALEEDRPLEAAVAEAAAALAEANDFDVAWALATGVGRLPGGARAATVGLVVGLHRRRQLDRAWEHTQSLGDEELARFVPVEAVDAALGVGTEAARARARDIAARTDLLSDASLVDLAGRFLVTGDRPTATALVDETRRRGGTAALDERRQRSLELIEASLDPRPTIVPEGAVPFAVIDYQSPDQALASGNVGDYIQTLSLLGNLARFGSVTFTGEDGLGDLATELQGRVRPKLRLPEVTGAMHLLPVNRDFSNGDDVPPGTWMIAFGWHMHPVYDLRYDFPYHPHIRPLFVSFHVNRLDMLSDDALAYLRAHGPVGCRDWTTVHLLLSAGVDAFFTGCLTSTVNAVFPPRAEVYDGDGVVGVIDLGSRAAGDESRPVEVHTHQGDEYRHMTLVDGVHAASDLLGDYQRRFHRAVTRRLHAYLPLTALGLPVTFRPWTAGDVRFPGLTGMRPGAPALRRMQRGIRELVSTTMAAALAGADEEEVYSLWREATAERVARAKERFAAEVEDPPTRFDVASAVAASRAASTRYGPHDDVDPGGVTDVVLCFDQNLTEQVPVLLESMVSNASGQLRLWVMTRGVGEAYAAWLAAAFPGVPMTFLPCDHIEYGEIGRVVERITISTMDRLLVPELLDDLDRLVYIDIDTLVLGDICTLGSLDLGGAPVAARDSVVTGVSEWRNVGKRLSARRSIELQRRMGARHGFQYAALNAGVLVLDLARMRADDFTRTYLGWVETYGLNDQDVMLAYAGPGRYELAPEWNALPFLEEVSDPKIVHWAGGGKPWWPRLAPLSATWRSYADRLRARGVGDAPPG